MKKEINKVNTLLEALPFIKEFSGETIVIKYGGSAQTLDTLKNKFAQDILLLSLVGIKPVIVHGGGKKITDMLSKLDIKTEFKNGHRVTTEEAMRVVEMVLSGDINKEITSLLNHTGVKAIGISGKDANCIWAKPKDNGLYGYTGVIEKVDSEVIQNLIDESFVPVIAPISTSLTAGHPGFNINADVAAAEIAVAINASKVFFLTDTDGILDKNKNLLHSLTEDDIQKLKDDETINGGMIPKVDSCLKALDGGVKKAHIINGSIEHSLLLELFTSNGIGTEIIR